MAPQPSTFDAFVDPYNTRPPTLRFRQGQGASRKSRQPEQYGCEDGHVARRAVEQPMALWFVQFAYPPQGNQEGDACSPSHTRRDQWRTRIPTFDRGPDQGTFYMERPIGRCARGVRPV